MDGWNNSYFNLNTAEWKAAGPGTVSADYICYSASGNAGAEFQLGQYRNGTWYQNLNYLTVIGSANSASGNGLPISTSNVTVQAGDSIVLLTRSADYNNYGTRQMNASASGGITFSPAPQADAPAFSPGAGTYTSSTSVTISSTTTAATIRYTTDGTTPSSTTGTVYSGAISVASSCTLKAIAYKTGMTNSDVTSGVYTIMTDVPVTSGLVVSLRADYGVSTSGSDVTTWSDGSGNGYNASPSTGTPTYSASGMNSKPTVNLTSGNVLGGSTSLDNDDWTVIMVYNYTGYGSLFGMNGLTSLGTYLDQIFVNYGDNNHWLYCGARYNNDNSYGLVTATGFAYIATLKFDGTNTTLYRNGATGAGPTVGGSNRNKNAAVGGSFTSYKINGGAMNVGEYLIYNRALTNTELNSVHHFLGTKYNISVTDQ